MIAKKTDEDAKTSSQTASAVKSAVAVTKVLFPWTIGPLAEGLVSLFVEKTENDMKGKSDSELERQLHHEQIKSEMLQAQAKAAFELALANRLANAREVEVEEHLETDGSGGVGLNVKEQTLGAHGKGSRVTRRIIRLRGWPDIQNEGLVLNDGTSAEIEPLPKKHGQAKD